MLGQLGLVAQNTTLSFFEVICNISSLLIKSLSFVFEGFYSLFQIFKEGIVLVQASHTDTHNAVD